jgi:hypothetical protein
MPVPLDDLTDALPQQVLPSDELRSIPIQVLISPRGVHRFPVGQQFSLLVLCYRSEVHLDFVHGFTEHHSD